MNEEHPRNKCHWTQEDLEYLCENWGCSSAANMQQRLQRSWKAITDKAYRLHLGPYLMSGDYVTANQLYIALRGYSGNSTRALSTYKWVQRISKRGMPFHKKKMNNKSVTVIDLDDFWKFAEERRDLFDFSLLEPLALGKEPDWVQEQRMLDKDGKKKLKRWTQDEKQQLKDMAGKYDIAEISERLGRTESAIRNMSVNMGLWEIYSKTHARCKLKPEDIELLEQYLIERQTVAAIAQIIGVPGQALRAYCYRHYGSSNTVKARAFILQQREKEKNASEA